MGERDIRISDGDREQAIRLLGEHLGEGRLDVDEYGDRSARVTTAKTRGDLSALFLDLPAPHPTFTGVVVEPVRRSGFQLDQRMVAGIVPAVGLLCVLLFFLFKSPFVFLLVPAAALLVGRLGDRR